MRVSLIPFRFRFLQSSLLDIITVNTIKSINTFFTSISPSSLFFASPASVTSRASDLEGNDTGPQHVSDDMLRAVFSLINHVSCNLVLKQTRACAQPVRSVGCPCFRLDSFRRPTGNSEPQVTPQTRARLLESVLNLTNG